MNAPQEPPPDWLEPVVAAAFESFVGDASSRRQVMLAVVEGSPGTGSRGLRVYAGFSAQPGRPAAMQLLIIESSRITADSLRQVPMAELERAFLGRQTPKEDPSKLPPLERGSLTPEAFSRLVAAHYLAWQEMDPHPAKRMAEENGYKQATVHSWIREARLRGVLPSPRRRARGELSSFPISGAAQAARDGDGRREQGTSD